MISRTQGKYNHSSCKTNCNCWGWNHSVGFCTLWNYWELSYFPTHYDDIKNCCLCYYFFLWCFCMTYTNSVWNIVMEKSYTWGHSITILWFTAEVFGCQPTSDSRKGENLETPHKTVATSVYQFWHWDCSANDWELRGLNLQFNIQPRLPNEAQYTLQGSQARFLSQWPQINYQQ